MRAIAVQRLGPPEVLELAEVPVPEPGSGQVLVRLHATGVSFADTERRRGVYARPALPWTPGFEGAGEVVAAGPGADPGLAGWRVAFYAMAPATSGTYAEPIDPDQLYDRCLKVSAFGLNVERGPAAWGMARRNLLEWLEAGDLKITISRRFSLAEAAEAHRLLESRASVGKIVLLPGAS